MAVLTKEEIRKEVEIDCNKIHEFILANPLVTRNIAIKTLIDNGVIRRLAIGTHGHYYKEKFGKALRHVQSNHERNILKNYIEENNIEKTDKIMEAIRILKEKGQIRSSISERQVYRIFKYLGREKKEKKVEKPIKIPSEMSRQTARKVIAEYEKYNFEGRIMSLEVQLAYKTLSV
jgi:hypothetical protein